MCRLQLKYAGARSKGVELFGMFGTHVAPHIFTPPLGLPLTPYTIILGGFPPPSIFLEVMVLSLILCLTYSLNLDHGTVKEIEGIFSNLNR